MPTRCPWVVGSASCTVQSALLFPSLVVMPRTACHALDRTAPTPDFAGGLDAHLSFSSNSTPTILIKSLCQFLPFLGISLPQRVSQLTRYDARRSREGMDQRAPRTSSCTSSTWCPSSCASSGEGVPPSYCFGLVGLLVSAVTAHFELLDACMHRVTEGDTSARVCSLLL